MGTISDKLMRIINTKEDIRQALISKGYDVPASIPFKEYAKMILDLPCNANSFPDIEGIVARYSASGLTNEQMAANPVWVDKTGNGHYLQLKNFAWKGMSGVGGYEMNFNLWKNSVPNIPDISMSTTTTSVSVSVGNSTYNNNLIYIHISNWDINKNHWLKVTSTYEDGDLAFLFYNDNNTKKIGLPANGYVNILAYPEFKGSYMYISTTSNKQGSFTIEQLPLYPGALVFDGVDDYGTCDNFPVLTKEKGYTVVALRQWITYNPNAISAIATNASDQSFNGAFTFENYNKGAEQTISYFSWQTTSKYNGVNISNGNKDATNSLVLGRSYPQRNDFANFAIWELVFLDHDATEEELTKIKDYFVKTYPWLFPDQAWTVAGKTNEDEDRATIANITGNGNNLVLSNFGFAEGSGYGLYKLNFNNFVVNNAAANINIVNVVNPHKIVLEQSQEVVGALFYGNGISYTGELKISVSNKPSDIELSFGSVVLGKVILNEGINIVKINPVNQSIGFFANKAFEAQNIIIEQIPEYEGYLVTDGVDDKITSSAFEMGKDWAVVGEWVLLTTNAVNAGIIKPNSWLLYNRTTGIALFINSATLSTTISNVKSIKAICSDGRIYLDDWSEMLISKDQDITSSTSALSIGFNGTVYPQIAFKNLGIYNNQILSKDDCIKAYNYLQTLKSK